MPVPTHSPDCQTRIFPTNCPDCGDDVFFFSCSCGSKVYFDLPNPPWNPHEDRCIPYLLRILIEEYHVPESQIRSLIIEYSKTAGIPIPIDVQRKLDEIDRRISIPLTLIDIHAEDRSLRVIGMVISVSPQVNFFRRFDYNDNAMGRGLLGKLIRDDYVEMLVREDADQNHQCKQYRVFQKLHDYQQSGIGQNSRMKVTLSPYMIPDGRKIWLVDKSERVV